MIETYKKDGISMKQYFSDECLTENREYGKQSNKKNYYYIIISTNRSIL